MTNSEFVDFGDIVPVDSIHYEIRKGNGEGSGWSIEIADASHPRAQAWSNEQSRKTLRRQQMVEAQQANGRKVKPDDREPEEVRRDNIGWVLSRIIGWTPEIKLAFISEEPLAYSEENATKVFMHPKMGFALSQLIDVIGDEKSFTKASANG